MQFFLFLALVIAAMAVLFAAQNNDPATVAFFVWKFKSSLALVMILSLFAGALISFFVSLPSNLRVRWSMRNQKKKIAELEKNLQEQTARLTELETALAHEKSSGELENVIPPPVIDLAENPQTEQPS